MYCQENTRVQHGNTLLLPVRDAPCNDLSHFLFYATLFLLVKQVVAGGGAVESALSVYLEHLATTLGSREQLAIAEFADALLIIPKVRPTNPFSSNI